MNSLLGVVRTKLLEKKSFIILKDPPRIKTISIYFISQSQQKNLNDLDMIPNKKPNRLSVDTIQRP